MFSIADTPQFQDAEKARAFLEKLRWPNGPVCPHCNCPTAYKLTAKPGSKKPVRPGVWKCKDCEQQFTVTMRTIFEDSHIPLHKWLLAIHLMCSSKKGVSAHQLWRNLWGTDETGKQLGSYRTAWFMAHRIRWALNQEPIAAVLSGIVEADETYIGGKVRPGPQAKKPGERPKDRLSEGLRWGCLTSASKGPGVRAGLFVLRSIVAIWRNKATRS